jgi:hypothetical protein
MDGRLSATNPTGGGRPWCTSPVLGVAADFSDRDFAGRRFAWPSEARGGSPARVKADEGRALATFGKPLATRGPRRPYALCADRTDRPRAAEFRTWHIVRLGDYPCVGTDYPGKFNPAT